LAWKLWEPGDVLDRSELESANCKLNEHLTSLKSDVESLTAQLTDANTALARVRELIILR